MHNNIKHKNIFWACLYDCLYLLARNSTLKNLKYNKLFIKCKAPLFWKSTIIYNIIHIIFLTRLKKLDYFKSRYGVDEVHYVSNVSKFYLLGAFLSFFTYFLERIFLVLAQFSINHLC